MANVKISQLPNLGNLASGTQFPVANAGNTFSVTSDTIKAYVVGSGFSVGNNIISNVATPIASSDAATRGYVDSATSAAITFADNSAQTTAIGLGDTLTFNSTANEVTVEVTAGNITFGLPDSVTLSGQFNAGNIHSNTMIDGGTGIFLSTGPSGYINFFTSAGNRVTIYDNGNLSAVGNITGGNISTVGTATIGGFTLSGNTIVSSGSTLTIDPAGPGGTTGLVVIQGNLQVEGNTTTINSNTVTTNDLVISVANNAINSSAANNGGFEVGPLGSPYLTWLFDNATTAWKSSGGITANGNITGSNLSVSTGTITVGNIVNSNANGVGNIGSSSTQFNTVFAKATSAQYADLAEKYTADADYTPGTVVKFGGSAEITVCDHDHDPEIAGVVSTNPAHIMNAGLQGEHVVSVALTGRVPCHVQGPVRRGQMLVSAGNGRARAETHPAMGTVIGKALEDFNGDIGTIEAVVGRL